MLLTPERTRCTVVCKIYGSPSYPLPVPLFILLVAGLLQLTIRRFWTTSRSSQPTPIARQSHCASDQPRRREFLFLPLVADCINHLSITRDLSQRRIRCRSSKGYLRRPHQQTRSAQSIRQCRTFRQFRETAIWSISQQHQRHSSSILTEMSTAARPAERSSQHDAIVHNDFSSLPAVMKMDRTNLGEYRM
jgi:hypothetical protein